MAIFRRWLQFSLRTFLVLLTVFMIWLGVATHHMRAQRDAVKAIEMCGGTVSYDWQYERLTDEIVFDRRPGKQPGAPHWLRSLVGDDFFQEVVGVAFFQSPPANREFADEEIRRWIPHLQKFPKLRVLLIDGACSDAAMSELTKALPGCNFI